MDNPTYQPEVQANNTAESAPVAQETGIPAEPSNAPSNEPPMTASGQRATIAIKTDPLTGRRQLVTFADKQQADSLQNEPNGVAYNQDGVGQQSQPQNLVAETTDSAQVTPQGDVQQEQPLVDPNIKFDPNGQPLFGTQQEQPVSEPYKTARELLQAIEAGNVDENRIPMELAFQYAAYKAQTKNTAGIPGQGSNAEAAETASQQQQISTDEARRQFYTRVEEIAHQAALQDSGLSEEQLAVVEYSDDPDIQLKFKQYQTAIAFHRQNVINNVQRKQMEQQQAAERQQSFMQNVYTEIEQLRSSEKEFDQIDVLMGSMYKQMPYEKAVRYANAIQAFANRTLTQAQAEDLRAYYKEARTHYYATKNGYGVAAKPSPAVPQVEKSGNGSLQQVADGKPKVTVTDLRNAAGNRKESRAILRELLIARDAHRQ